MISFQWSIIEWWRNNFPEIKEDPERSDKACRLNWMWEKYWKWTFESLPPAQIKMDKARSDIVVLSQSAKHYSFSGSQTEYFIRREKVKCRFMLWNVCHLHHPCSVSSWGWRKVFSFEKGDDGVKTMYRDECLEKNRPNCDLVRLRSGEDDESFPGVYAKWNLWHLRIT